VSDFAVAFNNKIVTFWVDVRNENVQKSWGSIAGDPERRTSPEIKRWAQPDPRWNKKKTSRKRKLPTITALP